MGTKRILLLQNKALGFTIVELLIVVVVIAILAAITIVAYNGITQRATISGMQENVKQTANKINLYKVDNGVFPPNLSALNMDSALFGTATLWAYTTTSSTFCLSVGSNNSTSTFHIADTDGSPQSGLCSGHTVASLSNSSTGNFPSREGYTNVSANTYAGDNTEVRIDSVPTGDWMIVIFSYTNNQDPGVPAGWTTIIPRHSTNTMQTSAYARIKQAGDSGQQLFDAAGTNGEPTVNGVLLWGGNGAAVNSWVIGAYGDRINNATSTTTLTPTVTTTAARSLVLSISTERTSADETIYSSLTGVTPWIWIPQPTGSVGRIQTIAIGYEEKATPGVSQAMTVTYPNVQSYNGSAQQIVIPPAT